jgi:hypothetical protein
VASAPASGSRDVPPRPPECRSARGPTKRVVEREPAGLEARWQARRPARPRRAARGTVRGSVTDTMRRVPSGVEGARQRPPCGQCGA